MKTAQHNMGNEFNPHKARPCVLQPNSCNPNSCNRISASRGFETDFPGLPFGEFKDDSIGFGRDAQV